MCVFCWFFFFGGGGGGWGEWGYDLGDFSVVKGGVLRVF